MHDSDSERGLTLAVSLGVGLPGFISFTTERAIAYGDKPFEFRNNTVTAPIGYACYSSSTQHHGFEYGFCAPYLSYGRNHPRYGDRLSLFIPLVCSLQLTREGAIGLSWHLPLFLPFLRVGITVLLKNPRSTIISRTVLDGADRILRRVFPAVRRNTA